MTLFRKAARGVELTEAGAKYLRIVSDAFDAIAGATDDIAQTKSAQIRVSAEPAFAATWLIHRLGRFRDAHPQYDVVLEVSPRLSTCRRMRPIWRSAMATAGGRGSTWTS